MTKTNGWLTAASVAGTASINLGTVASGSLVIVNVRNPFTSAGLTPSFSDSIGNTYSLAAERNVGGQFSAHIYYCANVTGGSNFTVQVTGASGEWKIGAAAFSGAETVSVLDDTSDNVGTSTTATPGAVVPTVTGLIVAVVAHNQIASTTPDGSMTTIAAEDGSSSVYLLPSVASTSYNPAWTIGINAAWWACSAAFKDASGSDVTPPTVSTWATNSAGTQITAVLSESGCTPSSGTGGFTLAGTSATVSGWAISGTTLTLTLSGSVTFGETVTVSYNDATASVAIADAASNLLADITAASVTNNTTGGSAVIGVHFIGNTGLVF